MSANNIKTDLEILKEASKEFKEAVEVFEPFTTTFIDSSIKDLESMKSDFVGNLKATLNNMEDNISKEGIKNLKNYGKKLDNTIETFKKTDKDLSESNKNK